MNKSFNESIDQMKSIKLRENRWNLEKIKLE